jgi:hypothetical protein
MTNQHDIKISGGYFPKNHNPHNPEAVRKWMEKLPSVRDLRVSDKAQDKLDELRLYASIKN